MATIRGPVKAGRLGGAWERIRVKERMASLPDWLFATVFRPVVLGKVADYCVRCDRVAEFRVGEAWLCKGWRKSHLVASESRCRECGAASVFGATYVQTLPLDEPVDIEDLVAETNPDLHRRIRERE